MESACPACGLTFDASKPRVPTQLLRRSSDDRYVVERSPDRILLSVPGVYRLRSQLLGIAAFAEAIVAKLLYPDPMSSIGFFAGLIVGAIAAAGMHPSKIRVEAERLVAVSNIWSSSRSLPRTSRILVETRDVTAGDVGEPIYRVQASADGQTLVLAHCRSQDDADEVAEAVRAALRDVRRIDA